MSFLDTVLLYTLLWEITVTSSVGDLHLHGRQPDRGGLHLRCDVNAQRGPATQHQWASVDLTRRVGGENILERKLKRIIK